MEFYSGATNYRVAASEGVLLRRSQPKVHSSLHCLRSLGCDRIVVTYRESGCLSIISRRTLQRFRAATAPRMMRSDSAVYSFGLFTGGAAEHGMRDKRTDRGSSARSRPNILAVESNCGADEGASFPDFSHAFPELNNSAAGSFGRPLALRRSLRLPESRHYPLHRNGRPAYTVAPLPGLSASAAGKGRDGSLKLIAPARE